MQTKGDLVLMKTINRGLILDSIRRQGPLSRAEIAKQTGLNPSTVTRLVAELINEGFVREGGFAGSQGGRRPIMLELVPNAVFIIGVSVEATFISGIIANLTAEVLIKEHRPLGGTSKEEIARQITEMIDDLLAKACKRRIKVVGIGLAMHGLVDSDRGIAMYPPAFGWRNLPVRDLLERHYKLPVRVDNNARSMVLGECWIGEAKGIDNVIGLKVGQGIGSGIVLRGSAFEGLQHSAGEIGHTTVAFDGPICDCGNYGCLESVASLKALVNQAKIHLKQGVSSKLWDFCVGDLDNLKPQHVFEAAFAGDKLAHQLLEGIGRYLGIAIANIINLLNPSKILLGGDIYPALEFVLPTIREIVQMRAMDIPKKSVSIEPVKLGENAVAIGAVTLILQEIFHREERVGNETIIKKTAEFPSS